ncbi:hypothetical protein VFPBJ_08106 [Purpureocillium lilacinum]|uniref:Uncharacterized protein n=1 Tax=Purpureocillium lilacinum TaxID=33203 RepID=A0A179GID2_PURLI|nr:hypothetical protein VFPBJ_08106 [Purpureocillium lilacinum]
MDAGRHHTLPLPCRNAKPRPRSRTRVKPASKHCCQSHRRASQFSRCRIAGRHCLSGKKVWNRVGQKGRGIHSRDGPWHLWDARRGIMGWARRLLVTRPVQCPLLLHTSNVSCWVCVRPGLQTLRTNPCQVLTKPMLVMVSVLPGTYSQSCKQPWSSSLGCPPYDDALRFLHSVHGHICRT